MRPSDEKFTYSENFEVKSKSFITKLQKTKNGKWGYGEDGQDGAGGSWLGDQYMKTIDNDQTKLTSKSLKDGIVLH